MKIFIEDYKNIKNLTLSINSGLLMLLGSNGVGKTNILEAISYGNCIYGDIGQFYSGPYFLSLSPDEEITDYYPNARLLKDLFPEVETENLHEAMRSYLEYIYEKSDRPLLKKLVRDAADSLHYAQINRKYDPSTLAIIRLVVLNKIYESVKKSGVPAIILIDTPELHAHQLLQNAITATINSLRESGCTIILSTHSQYIVSKIFTSFDQLCRLNKLDDGQVTITMVDMEKISNDIQAFYAADEYLVHNFSRAEHIEQGLHRLLSEDLEGYLITAFRDYIITAFFSKVVVIGEGSSEDVLFDYIENVLRPNWILEYEIGFIHGWGKSTLPLFFIFLNNIGVRVLVLYDYDNDNNPVHVAYRNAFNRYHFDNPALFASYYLKPDLEGYLNMSEEDERIPSLIKPVNVYNYTFLSNGKNEKLNKLLGVMKENIERMFKK